MPNSLLVRVASWVGLASLFVVGQRAPDTLRLYETAPLETNLAHEGWPATHEVWIERIDAAASSIALAHFYASDREGSRLGPVVEALERAAARGVHVRFLADAKFQSTYPETLARLDAWEGMEVRTLDLSTTTGGVLHAKFMLLDARYTCLGSANFDWRALEHIQELGVELDSAAVARAFTVVFDADWARAGGEPVAAEGVRADVFPVELSVGDGALARVTPVFSPERLLPTGATWDLPRLVAAIDGARERVCLQLLSYQTTDREGRYFAELESALRRAAARGCDVRLMLADWSKRKWTIEGLQSLQALPRVTVKLVTIPQAKEGFIPFARVAHAKYLVCDGKESWIGTSNWSREYFHESRNVGVMIESEAVGKQLEAFFASGWESEYAEVVDPGKVYEEPRVGE